MLYIVEGTVTHIMLHPLISTLEIQKEITAKIYQTVSDPVVQPVPKACTISSPGFPCYLLAVKTKQMQQNR